MGRRSSIQQSDGTVWQTVALPLGGTGLDLRRPDSPGTLVELLNARFLDERTVARRDGHTGRAIQSFTSFQQDKEIEGWVYGHGTQISLPAQPAWEDEHHPVSVRGGGTFKFNDTDVVWTGDRLFIATEDGPFHGGSYHWNRDGSNDVERRGIPAYLPVMDDSFPARAITGDYIDTCVTETQRLLVHSISGGGLQAIITDRATGAVISDELIDANDVLTGLRVLVSGGYFMVIWLTSAGLFRTYWTGQVWSTPDTLDPDADAFDATAVSGGSHVVWRVADAIFMGYFSGFASQDLPYTFGDAIFIGDSVPNGAVALAVSPAGDIVVVWEASAGVDPAGLYGIALDAQLSVPWDTLLNPSADTGWDGGLTVCFRGLANSDGRYPVLIHGSRGTSVEIWEYIQSAENVGGDATLNQTDVLHNATLASKSFLVGDEVMAWVHAQNSDTLALIAGAYRPPVCGSADDEVAVERVVTGGVRFLPSVARDPAGEELHTWVRPFNAGLYALPTNVRIGDIDFLPALSAAEYGKSVYLAGSLTRNWDGVSLGDAGYHDYPVVTAGVPSNGAGSMANSGVYYARVYAVRYNARGERFQSVAVTSEEFTLGASDDTLTLTISTMPCTNDDVVFEVYRTKDIGTTFYLEGTVANDREAASVEYVCSVSDDTLTDRPADPHTPSVDTGLTELEESGPTGCRTVITAGDRLWCIGGQVAPGTVVHSKLYEVGEGAGFDALAGYAVIDATGGRMTSIAAFSDTTVVAFQRDRLYVLTGQGPDNFGVGGFRTPEVALVDGATTHAGTVVLPIGIAYWGDSGPRLLTTQLRVENICAPVRAFSATLSPSGVQVELARDEVVWYTSTGQALLWNYGNGSRWARWNNLPVAGCSSRLLVTTDGRVLAASSTPRDDGRRFVFRLETGNIRPEAMLQGHTLIRRMGFVGEYLGDHTAYFKVYYDGSPLWSEKFKWHPADTSWLAPASDWEDLTAAEIDALDINDHSGAYGFHRRVKRQTCQFFRIGLSDNGQEGFTPWELTFEIGQIAGLGRATINTFSE